MRPDFVNPRLIDQKMICLIELRCAQRKNMRSCLLTAGDACKNPAFRSGTKYTIYSGFIVYPHEILILADVGHGFKRFLEALSLWL